MKELKLKLKKPKVKGFHESDMVINVKQIEINYENDDEIICTVRNAADKYESHRLRLFDKVYVEPNGMDKVKCTFFSHRHDESYADMPTEEDPDDHREKWRQ